MRLLKELFDNNRRWAEEMNAARPGFFAELSKQQAPSYLWIGCADSRVPANEIVGLPPGELFVHRNVANIVSHTDLNCLAVIQYAVEMLQVRHVIVCGHYACGGVRAAMAEGDLGLIDNWLRNIKELYRRHARRVDAEVDPDRRVDRLCELNVMAQVANVCRTTIVHAAWKRGQELAVHGWIYRIQDGLLRDLGVCVSREEQIPNV